jgi:hypothetical protein
MSASSARMASQYGQKRCRALYRQDMTTPDKTPVALAAETKWIKRFRRTLLNRLMRENSPVAWDSLVTATWNK